MGTIRFGAVSFQVFSFDHLPRHAHAKYAGIDVIVEFERGIVRLAQRTNAIRPPDAKRSDVAHILKAAELKKAELNRLWEDTHGA